MEALSAQERHVVVLRRCRLLYVLVRRRRGGRGRYLAEIGLRLEAMGLFCVRFCCLLVLISARYFVFLKEEINDFVVISNRYTAVTASDFRILELSTLHFVFKYSDIGSLVCWPA